MVVDKYAASDLMILNRPHFIGAFEFLNPPLFRSDFHVAFSRHAVRHKELKTNFDRGLATLQRSGDLADLLRSNGLRVEDRSPERRETITIGTVNNPDMLVMRSLSAEFEKVNPGVHLDWNILDENTLRTRLMTDLAINDGQFDVMTIGSYETQIWAARSWLTPLGGTPGSYDVDDLISTVRDSLSYRGMLYALPFYSESSMTYYRTDLFREAGVMMPTRPTWADIQRLAAAVHDPQRGIFGVCLRGKPGWGENIALVSTMLNTFGGRWFDEKWMPEIDSAPWRKAVGIYVDLLARFGPPDSNHNSYNENLTLFSQGRCAIWVDATVAAGTLFNPKKSKVASRLGIAPAPAERPDTGAHWLWTWALALPQSSKHQSTARRFIEWATSKAYIRSVARQEGWVAVPPGTRSSTYRSSGYQAAAPFSPHVLDAIVSAREPAQPLRPYTGIQYVSIPEFPAIGHKVGEEISQALTGKITVEQALGDAQTWVAQQMEASGYIRGSAKAAP
jgi:sorbitol/mannitol transport system substrate-binding protein